MLVLREVAWLLRWTAGGVLGRRGGESLTVTAADSQELAGVMRALPDRYADRLPERTVRRVAEAAAAGRWETAVTTMIGALDGRSVPVTAAERAELATAAGMLGVPARGLPNLPAYDAHHGRPPF